MCNQDCTIPSFSLAHLYHLWRLRRWQTLPRPRFLLSDTQLPRFVQTCPVTMNTIRLLRLLDWPAIPAAGTNCFGREPVPPAAYIAAFLVRLEQGLPTLAHLRRFLVSHPPLVWALGFPLSVSGGPYGFAVEASLPTQRHFATVLRNLPNELLQKLLGSQVSWLQTQLPAGFGRTVSLDTKHILAWTKENNPKAYIKEKRFDKTQQATGDPDCKVGCKRRHNRVVTPAQEGKPASGFSVSAGEYYWGYASGAVVTKVPHWGEFVLAEMTQTFNHGDTTYFFPLMEQVEQRLGFKPPNGTADAAYDAWYVYQYFHEAGGLAAVPLSAKGGKPDRQFSEDGLPLCAAGLPMPVKFTFTDRTTTIIAHRKGHHVCPLLYPESTGRTCPIDHKNWQKGKGCTTRIADYHGARLRYQIDRESETYKALYKQRTAVERIFSQAFALGIERPKLRNQQAITNQNTLIYLLINLRAMQRVCHKLAQMSI